MRFETLIAGEARQVDGPFYGVKVLSADPGQGASLSVNGLVWPVAVLPSWAGDIDKVVAVGPCILALATDEDEDLSKMTANPPPSALTPQVTRYAFVGSPTNFNTNPATMLFRRPAGYSRLAVWAFIGPNTQVCHLRVFALDASGAPQGAGLASGTGNVTVLTGSPTTALAQCAFAAGYWGVGNGQGGTQTIGAQLAQASCPPGGVRIDVIDTILDAGAFWTFEGVWLP